MRRIAKLVLGVAFLSLLIIACKEKKAESDTNEAAGQQTEVSPDQGGDENTGTIAVLNANLATENDLSQIGLSAEMVAQILEKRPFLTMNDFDVLVDSDADKAELYQKIFVPFNLNTTAEADFKMIPGVGDRMAHEFEEYRPYTSIQQFRREIGKYVVARREQKMCVRDQTASRCR